LSWDRITAQIAIAQQRLQIQVDSLPAILTCALVNRLCWAREFLIHCVFGTGSDERSIRLLRLRFRRQAKLTDTRRSVDGSRVGVLKKDRLKIQPAEYLKSILILIVASSLLAGIAIAQTRQTWDRVTVQVSTNVNVSPTLLKDGQAATTAIFARIHIHLNWPDQRSKNVPASTVPAAEREITVEIVPHAPHSVNDVALAMAMPYTDSGMPILIFYDRLDPLLQGHHAPGATILAYVLAHEIGHVLEGVARHSETGIMRARWTDNDLRQMGNGVLSYTTEDVRLIRRHLQQVDSSTSPGPTAGL
jgi:hypothetical protein